MSEEINTSTATTAVASTESSAPTGIVGESVGQLANTPQADTNPYQERFGAFSDHEGNFNDGTRNYLEGLGFDSGRIERMERQGNIDNVFKALDNAQSLIEKRDGNRSYIPDPSNETEFNAWRDEKGIPRDPSDPQNGYNFKSGLEEGTEAIIPTESLAEIGKVLHQANIPKEQANELISLVNGSLSQLSASKQEQFTNETLKREQDSYNSFKEKHGFEFEKKEAQLGQSAKAYDFDFSDPNDRIALTNPKVMQLLVDNAEMSSTTAPMLDAGASQAPSLSAGGQMEQIMRDHPNGAWKRDSSLVNKMNILAKQATAQAR